MGGTPNLYHMDPQLIERYGLYAALVYILLRDLIPKAWGLFADRIWPERIKEQREAAKAVRDADATLLRARIEREDRESETRLKLEERSVATQERQEAILSAIQISISGLQVWATNHDRFTFNSTQDIKGSIEKLQDMDDLRKKQSKLEEQMRDTQEKLKKGKSE